jgi:hypothetical protein
MYFGKMNADVIVLEETLEAAREKAKAKTKVVQQARARKAAAVREKTAAKAEKRARQAAAAREKAKAEEARAPITTTSANASVTSSASACATTSSATASGVRSLASFSSAFEADAAFTKNLTKDARAREAKAKALEEAAAREKAAAALEAAEAAASAPTRVEPEVLGAEEEKHADEDFDDAKVVEILAGSGNASLLPLFREHEVDDGALFGLEADDLSDMGVAPAAAVRILCAINASRMARSKLAVNEVMDDSARHQAALEAELADHRAELERLKIRREEVPERLTCAITCELMKDPVMASDGHTFERVAIEQWFERAKTSPVTNELLPDTRLVPNHTVKSMIAEFLEQSRALVDS